MKKRADGRYCKQILLGYTPEGKRKMKTIYGKTIKEVEQKEREIRDDVDKGIFVLTSNDITVSEWADEWLATYKSSLSYNTVIRYENIVNCHLKPRIGQYKLSQVKLATVQKLINEMNSYSISTLKKVRDTIHQMYKTAMANELVFKDPTVGIILPKKHNEERKPISESIVRKVVEFYKYNHIALMPIVLIYTGMRRGEIVALTWEDIDFKNKTIHVNKSVIFKNNRPEIAPTKTQKSNRKIPMLDITYEILQKHRNETFSKRGFNLKQPVFVNTLGEQHTVTSLRRLWDKFLKELNEFYYNDDEIIEFGMHQLRHTFCTLLYKANVDMKTAQEILGHSDISITLKVYTHLDQELKNISVEKLNDYISSTSLSQSKISQT